MSERPIGTVTFLFTDIVGSTLAWERDSAMGKALRLHDQVVHEVVGRFDGFIFSVAGDGYGIAFGRPDAAVRAAVEMQRAFAVATWPTQMPVRVRMGIHTGVAEERDDNYFGSSPNRAARVMAVAAGGQVVLSETSARLVAGAMPADIDLVDLGRVRLRGFAERERVVGVVAEGLDGALLQPRAAGGSSGSLPRSSDSFVGRDELMSKLVAQLTPGVLMTLVGPGGVGKTRLAESLARTVIDRFADGVWWVPLAAAIDEPGVIAQLASVLEVRGAGSDRDALQVVAEALDGVEALVVLDNAEQVLGPTRDVVGALRRSAPQLALLVTSRAALREPSEAVVVVDPLQVGTAGSPGAAVRLLMDRVGMTTDTGGPSSVAFAEIARRLDGLPLALELAAWWCRTLGPDEVAADLAGLLPLLEDPGRVDARQRNLSSMLSWSIDLLAADDRLLLSRIAVCHDGFTLDAACGIGNMPPGRVRDGLARLVDASLVRRTGGRYELLQTTREVLIERHRATSSLDQLERDHAAWFVRWAREAAVGLAGRDDTAWTARVLADWSNVRAAFERTIADDDIESATVFVVHLQRMALYRPEAWNWPEQVYQRLNGRRPEFRAEVIAAAALAVWMRGDYDVALDRAQQAIDATPLGREPVDDLPAVALAGALAFTGRPDRAATVVRERVSHFRRTGRLRTLAESLANLSYWLALSGDVPGATEACEEADSLAEYVANAGTLAHVAAARVSSAAVARSPAALELADRALELAEATGNFFEAGIIRTTRGAILAAAGRHQDCVDQVADTTDRYARAGMAGPARQALQPAIVALMALGRHRDAAFTYGAANPSRPTPNEDTAETHALADALGFAVASDTIAAGRAARLQDVVRTLRRPTPADSP